MFLLAQEHVYIGNKFQKRKRKTESKICSNILFSISYKKNDTTGNTFL